MLAFLVASPVFAATLVVGPGGYGSIGAAVGAAVGGDTIEVGAGTWDASVTVGKDLVIVGVGGPGVTTWGSDFASDSVDIVNGATVTIEGFTFDPDGRAVDLNEGALTLRDIVVTGNTVFDRPGAALRARPGTTLVVEDSELSGNEAAFWPGGHVYAKAATVTVRRSTLSGGTAPEGGGLWAEDSWVTLEDATFAGNTADSTGGAVHLIDSVGSVSGTVFTGNAADYGGAVYLDAGSLDLLDSYLADNTANVNGGGVRWRQDGGELRLDGAQLDRNVAGGEGGALATSVQGPGGELFVDASHFTGNRAAAGGALALADHDGLVVTGTRLCHNAADDGGGAWVQGNGGLWLRNDFVGNEAAGDGGALLFDGAVDALVGNNDFLANHAARGGAMHASGSSVAFVNDLVAWNTGTGVTASATTGVLSYGLFFDNDPAGLSAELATVAGPGIVEADPMLTAFSDDGDCGNDDLTPLPGSPLIDAGDPSLTDDDGTRSDIGSVVGPSPDVPCATPATFYADGDGDGFGNVLEPIEACEAPAGYVADSTDCRDDDPAAFPGAAERCNGLDDDCDDGIDDGLLVTWWPDGDGDGVGAGVPVEQCSPPEGYATVDGDCDDTDPDVQGDCNAPTSVVPDDEGIQASGACGCQATSGAATWGGLGLMALVGMRRRR